MAQEKWLYCQKCKKDQVFQWVPKYHVFVGNHTEWHCTTCGECKYKPAQEEAHQGA